LAQSPSAIPIAQGGAQSLLLDFGSTNANRLYWIFGSITGTAPGVTLSGVHIPLNPDPYTDLRIANVTANPPFNAFRGVLDAIGMASAALIVPTGLPPLPFTLYHACLVYDAAGRFYTASPAVPISLR
jgi:hypothetical protein